MSYINTQAAKNLNLKSLRKQYIVVKIFGNVKALKKLDIVQFVIKSNDENLNTYINAFITDICHPVEHQQTDLENKLILIYNNLI